LIDKEAVGSLVGLVLPPLGFRLAFRRLQGSIINRTRSSSQRICNLFGRITHVVSLTSAAVDVKADPQMSSIAALSD
jgi:hypothetical protein